MEGEDLTSSTHAHSPHYFLTPVVYEYLSRSMLHVHISEIRHVVSPGGKGVGQVEASKWGLSGDGRRLDFGWQTQYDTQVM